MISALVRIPATLRVVLLLRSWDKLAYQEIKIRTGIPSYMVSRLLLRARLLLVYYRMADQPLSNLPTNSGSE